MAKQTQNELIATSTRWLSDTLLQLNPLSTESISIQYDQTSNRLKDLAKEIQLKLSRIHEIPFLDGDDPSAERSRVELINQLETAQAQIHASIQDREQTRIAVQAVDQSVLAIQQTVKTLRSALDHHRLGANSIDELQVNLTTDRRPCSTRILLLLHSNCSNS